MVSKYFHGISGNAYRKLHPRMTIISNSDSNWNIQFISLVEVKKPIYVIQNITRLLSTFSYVSKLITIRGHSYTTWSNFRKFWTPSPSWSNVVIWPIPFSNHVVNPGPPPTIRKILISRFHDFFMNIFNLFKNRDFTQHLSYQTAQNISVHVVHVTT